MIEEENKVLVINSEESAFAVLQKMLSEKENFQGSVVFQGWPVFSSKIEGDRFHSTLNASLMKGFITLQKELNKSYTLAKYGDSNTSRLTQQEKDQLLVDFRVSQGSSNIVSENLSDVINAFGQGIANMESHHLATTIVVCALLYFGHKSIAAWLSSKQQQEQEINKDKTLVELAKDSTEKMRILAEAISSVPLTNSIKAHAESAHEAILKSVKNADNVELQGIRLDNEQLKSLVSTEKRTFTLNTFNKDCRILKIDTSDALAYKVTILILDTYQHITCALEDESIDKSLRTSILEALANRKNITLMLEARDSAGELKDVKILGTAKDK